MDNENFSVVAATLVDSEWRLVIALEPENRNAIVSKSEMDFLFHDKSEKKTPQVIMQYLENSAAFQSSLRNALNGSKDRALEFNSLTLEANDGN